MDSRQKKLHLSPVDACPLPAPPIALLFISLPNSTVIPPKKQANDGSDRSIQLCRVLMVPLLQQEALHVGEVGKGCSKEHPGIPRKGGQPLNRCFLQFLEQACLPVAPLVL